MALLNELRSSLHLRLGLALIVFILGAYGLLEWQEFGQAKLLEYKQLASQAARLGGQRNQAEWPARAEQAKVALVKAEQRLWRNSSFGQAQAEVQDRLYTLLRQVAAKNFAVKLTDGPSDLVIQSSAERTMGLAGVKQLRARVEFSTDPQVMLALLAALNDAEHQIAVDTLNFKGTQAQLDLSVWYDLTAASEPAAAPTSGRALR